MTDEKWVTVQNYDGCYEVSSFGRVRSVSRCVTGRYPGSTILKKGRILRQRTGKWGYAYVVFSVESQRKTMKVHRLVANEFCKKGNGMNVVNHIDGNKANNHFENLEWTNNDGNMQHAVINGLIPKGSKAHGALLTEEQVKNMRTLFKNGVSQKQIGKLYNLNRFRVFDVVRNRIWKHVTI